jgi:cephalosporin hydroxylase
MASALWRQTGGIWPMGVSSSLTWYDLGAIAYTLQAGGIRAVLEIGVEHGGLSAWLLAYCRYTGCAYRGVDISLGSLQTRVRDLDLGSLVEQDAWSAAAIADARAWLESQPSPALIICDGGDKPKELHLYAPLLRPGDVLLGHDYHNEYVDDAIATVPAERVHADWLDDTLLCCFVRTA